MPPKSKQPQLQQPPHSPKTQYPNPNLADPWYSTRIQKDMGYLKRVKSLYLRHVVVERMETAEMALQWYLQLSSGETIDISGNGDESKSDNDETNTKSNTKTKSKTNTEIVTMELNTSRDPFGDVAKQLSACSMTRDEGGKIGWVDLPSDDNNNNDNNNDDDKTSNGKGGELSFASLIPDDILEKLVALQPKAGDVHIVGPSSTTNQVHVVRVEELYIPNVLLPKAIDRVYNANDGDDDVKLGSFNGVNGMFPRNKLKGHGVMPRVPKFERKRTGTTTTMDGGDGPEPQQQQPRTYVIQTNGCQMNVADSERLEGILQDELGLVPIPDGASKEEVHKADVVIFNTCSIRDHAEQKLYDALGPFRARKRQKKISESDRKNGNTNHKSSSDFALIVTGCVAQQEGKALLRKIPEIDVVLGPQYVPYLGSILEQIEWGHQLVVTAPTIIADNYKAAETSSSTTTTTGVESSFSREESPGRLIGDKKSVEGIPKAVIPSELLPENDDFSAKPIRGHSVRAWVNVIYGCNEHCTYCV
jgi:hypothetical protein